MKDPAIVRKRLIAALGEAGKGEYLPLKYFDAAIYNNADAEDAARVAAGGVPLAWPGTREKIYEQAIGERPLKVDVNVRVTGADGRRNSGSIAANAPATA